jgi:hypothetical protein
MKRSFWKWLGFALIGLGWPIFGFPMRHHY